MLKLNSSLPPQPYDYDVPNSDISLRFTNFGLLPLSELDTAWCLLDASALAIIHWGLEEPIGPIILVAMYGDVVMHLVSTNDITWYQWATAIRGITDFVDRYEAVRMDFTIQTGQGLQRRVIAGGVLSLES